MDRRRVAMGSDGEHVMLASLIVFVYTTLSPFVFISRLTYTIYRLAYTLRSAAPPVASFDFPDVFLLVLSLSFICITYASMHCMHLYY